jgi:hypothetical protein
VSDLRHLAGKLDDGGAARRSAGASERTVRMIGEFQGAMMPATPIGWRRISEMLPGFGVTARPLPTSAAAA